MLVSNTYEDSCSGVLLVSSGPGSNAKRLKFIGFEGRIEESSVETEHEDRSRPTKAVTRKRT